jgi:hypothetical protein
MCFEMESLFHDKDTVVSKFKDKYSAMKFIISYHSLFGRMEF